MSNNIDIQFTVDDAAAFRAWQRQQTSLAKMKSQLDALKGSGNAAGTSIGSIGGKAAAMLKDAGAQLTGIGTAVGALVVFSRQLIAEIENIKRKNIAAGQTNVGIAPSLNTAAQNAGGAITTPAILAMAKKTGLETGQAVSKVLDTFGAAWAAGAPANEAEARAIAPVAKAVLNTFPTEDAETTAQISGVVKSLMKREGMTEDEATGFYLKAAEGNFSRGNSPLSKHAIPAGLKGTAFGDTVEQSMATVNTFSQSMLDPDGALSSHAANVFQEQLRERLPDMPNTTERIKYLRERPEEAKAYMHGGTIAGKKFDKAKLGEGASIPTVEGILGLNNAPAYAGLFGEIQAGADKIRAAGANRQGLVERKNQQVRSNLSTGPQVLAAQERQAQSTKELTQLADSEAAAKGIASQGFAGVMESSDMLQIQQWARSQGHFFSGGGAGDLAAEMDRLGELQVSKEVPRMGPAQGHGGVYRGTDLVPNENATDEQKIKAANYRAAAKRLRELEAQRKTGVADTNREELGGPGKAKIKISEARKAAEEIQADKNITAEEAAAARAKVRSATESVRAEEGNLSGDAVKELKAQIFQLSQVIEAQIKATQQNTKATDNNTAAPTPATTSNPPRPRNNQASRALGRGSPLVGGP